MARVLVVTDSSACLAEDAHPRLRVVPITILLHGTERTDHPEAADDVYAALASRSAVRSSPPLAHDYVKAIEQDDFDAAVVITPAREFTVMHRNAELAARLADRPVEVIDCRTAAAAQTLVVRAALRAADQRRTLSEVAAVVRATMDRAELVAMLPSRSAVERNIGLPKRARGRVAGAMPALFRFHDGAVSHIADLHPTAEPAAALAQAWRASGGSAPWETLVFHAGDEALAVELGERLRRRTVVPFSPAMAIHTGPGWVGVAWLRPSPTRSDPTPTT